MNHAGLTVLRHPAGPARVKPSTPTAQSADELLAELCALQHYVMEILEVQQFEPEVRGVTPAASLIERALAKFRRQSRELGDLIAAKPNGGDQLRAAVAGKCALFFRYISKQRSRDLPGILRDDFTLFSLAATQYRQLRARAATAGDAALVALADSHHDQLAPLMAHLAMMNAAPQHRPAWADSPPPPPQGDGNGRSSLPWPQAI